MTKTAVKTFRKISFPILSRQRETLEKFKSFLHKNQHANNAENSEITSTITPELYETKFND